jgi:hypothetical protein
MHDPSAPIAYMNCPDCGLSVPLRARFMTLDVCPRCLARRRVARPMILSESRPQPAIARAHRPLAPDIPAAA